MKIIHIITSINKGGAENHLYRLTTEQSKKNNNVKILFFKGDGYWQKYLKKLKVTSVKFNLSSNYNILGIFIIFLKLLAYITKEKPDIVHAHLALPEILVLLIKLFFNLKFKFVVTKHLDSLIFEGSYGQNKYLNGIFVERLIFKLADHVIFISKNVEKYFLSKIRDSAKNSSVIYYGIDKYYFNYNSKFNKNLKNLKDNKKQFVVLNIARHIPQKRIDLLLLGFSEFAKKNDNTKLILVGSGPDTKKLNILSNKLNIFNKIVWIDYTENIIELFKMSNVFCLTSEYEGLGLVLLESMYLKKPIITVRKSAMREIINNSYNGITLKDNFKPKDLSDCFEKIKKNKEFKNKIIKNARLDIKKKFSVKKMYNQTNEIYKKK